MPTDPTPTERRSAGSARDGAAGADPDEGVDRAEAGVAATDREEGGTVRLEASGEEGRYPVQAPASEEFGREGWAVVAVLLFSFLVVPPAIVLLPEARGLIRPLGLTLRDAYLALPMIPAILLGITAVWAAVRHRRQ